MQLEEVNIIRREMVLFSKKSKVKEMNLLIKKFIKNLEDRDILDEKLKNDIIELATTWNKEELMDDLINKIEVHKSYDEEKGVQFPYRSYVERFFSREGQREGIKENSIYDKDVFLKGLQKGGKSSRAFDIKRNNR